MFYVEKQSQAEFVIDELRIFPKESMFSTFTYNHFGELIGTTSPRGLITTLLYDSCHRLKAQYNDDGFLTDLYTYHLPNQPGERSWTQHTQVNQPVIHLSQDFNAISLLHDSVKSTKIEYKDGLNRTEIVVLKNASTQKKDIVSFKRYDQLSRVKKEYLPFTQYNFNPDYNDFENLQANFHGSAYAFTEKKFDQSIDSRILAQSAPGETWSLNNPNHLKFRLSTNSGEEVVCFSSDSTYYQAGTLLKYSMIDENGQKTSEFKDRLNRLILKVENEKKTYYVHNATGKISHIIPPEVFKKMENSGNYNYLSNHYAKSIYINEYDQRGRLFSSVVPGSDPTQHYYNGLNREIFTIYPSGYKEFIKYDGLGRVIQKGAYSGIPSNNTSLDFEKRKNNINGYTNKSIPTQNIEIHQTLYYDDFDFDRNGFVSSSEMNANFINYNFISNQSGLLTKSVESVLGIQEEKLISTLQAFDKKGNVIYRENDFGVFGKQTQIKNYSFAGWLLKDSTHTEFLGIQNDFSKRILADHMGRTSKVFATVNQQDEKLLFKYDYTEQGQIAKKNLGSNSNKFLQVVDYHYNIRGWLSSINGSPVCSNDINQNQDLFSLKIYYDEINQQLGNIAQYNGNISAIKWQEHCGKTPKAYVLSYDNYNELLQADYFEAQAGQVLNVNHFDVDHFSYDLNGNIKSLRRKDKNGATIDSLYFNYNYKDQLTQIIEHSSKTTGYVENGGNEFSYDASGNIVDFEAKNLKFTWNHLNKPNLIIRSAKDSLRYMYSYSGMKIQRISKLEDGTGHFKNYLGNLQFVDGDLEAIYFEEGRILPEKDQIEYVLRDQLGNNRVFFSDLNKDGQIEKLTEVLQIANYYPFGMLQEENHHVVNKNQHLFSNKELEEELNINLYDFGSRYYDPSFGRWISVDPKAQSFSSWSAYNYVQNNPLRLIDPNGESPVDPYKQLIDLVNRVFRDAPLHIARDQITNLQHMMRRNDLSKSSLFSEYFPVIKGINVPYEDGILKPNEMLMRQEFIIYGDSYELEVRHHKKKYPNLTDVTGIEFYAGRAGKGTSSGAVAASSSGYLIKFYNSKNTVLTILIQDKRLFQTLQYEYNRRSQLHFKSLLDQADPQLKDFYKFYQAYQKASAAYRKWQAHGDAYKAEYNRASVEYEKAKEEYYKRWDF